MATLRTCDLCGKAIETADPSLVGFARLARFDVDVHEGAPLGIESLVSRRDLHAECADRIDEMIDKMATPFEGAPDAIPAPPALSKK